MIQIGVISQEVNHCHVCSNPYLLSVILGKTVVRQKLGKLRNGLACLQRLRSTVLSEMFSTLFLFINCLISSFRAVSTNNS